MLISPKFFLPLLLGFAMGCSSSETTVFDEPEIKPDGNSPQSLVTTSQITDNELSEVAAAAAQALMSDERSNGYIAKLRSSGSQKEIPVIKCGDIINNTGDPDLRVVPLFRSLQKNLAGSERFVIESDLSPKHSDTRLRPPELLLVPCISQNVGLKENSLFLRRTYAFTLADVEGIVVWGIVKYIDIPVKAPVSTNISAVDEFEKITTRAMMSLTNDGEVAKFIAAYKNSHGNGEAAPVVKIAKIKNGTSTPEFTNGLVWILQNGLQQTGKFRLSACEGATGLSSLNYLRDAVNGYRGGRPVRFAKADLTLCGSVKENSGKDDKITREYRFSLVADQTGEVIWTLTQALEYKHQ